MAIVDINIIKEWFKNLKKPTQEQFWTWLDSFRHKWEKVPLDDVEGLTSALQKKADLVNGMVPENQLPFTINTNEVINIGAITVTTNNVNISIHESGSNKVRINGQILTRAFSNDLPFIPVTIGQKFLRIVARNEPGLFFLKQSTESDEPQEPSLDQGEVHVRLILVTPDGSYIDPELLNGFKEKVEDTWKKSYPTGRTGNFYLQYSDKRTYFSLEPNFLGVANGFSNIVFSVDESRDVTFTIRNNYGMDVTLFESDTDGLVKGIFNYGEDFVLKQYASVIVKYNHELDRLEILKFGATVDLSAYHTIAQYQQWVANQNFATNTALTTGLNNRYVIATTSIASPDATYLYTVMSNAAGVTRRLDLSTYLLANFATISSVNTSIANAVKSKIQITTAVDITSDTNDSAGFSQKGKSTNINNGATNINYTVNAGLSDILVGMKTGTGSVTFLQGSGVTLVQKDGSNILDGASGGQYKIEPTQTANIYFLFLTTYE